jgi:HAD superfamily hydrolase (TIGR01450 family)
MRPLPFSAILIDMDGVLFHGDRALPGAVEFLTAIADRPHGFVTNNPIRTPDEIARHFVALGLPRPDTGRIVTSAEATARWLADQRPGFRYFAIGGGGLEQALSDVGSADAEQADFVVVGEGPGIDYASLTTAINLILRRDARLVCTNPDHNVDATIDGRHQVLPGGGALVAPIAVATGVDPVFIGKPNPALYEIAMARLGVGPDDCVMIGDRPDTDIAGAQALGMATALVRTGRFAPGEPLPDGVRPDWDCADLAELMRVLGLCLRA